MTQVDLNKPEYIIQLKWDMGWNPQEREKRRYRGVRWPSNGGWRNQVGDRVGKETYRDI